MKTQPLTRRNLIKLGASAAVAMAVPSLARPSSIQTSDPLPLQLYGSLSAIQRRNVCLARDDPRRMVLSNALFFDRRIFEEYNPEQVQLIKQIFNALHGSGHADSIMHQVAYDNFVVRDRKPQRSFSACSAGFFGCPDDDDFEFVIVGHHVIRRWLCHSDQGAGFAGRPVFYGQLPGEGFYEKTGYPGSAYWFQSELLNEFYSELSTAQQNRALVTQPLPREFRTTLDLIPPESIGLPLSDLSGPQGRQLHQTLSRMLDIFRPADRDDCLGRIGSVPTNELHIAFYGGDHDFGGDGIWDRWLLKGRDVFWYFRGYPHVHAYLKLGRADGEVAT